jgi:hypothetical protein
MNLGKITILHMAVSDADKAKKFYVEILSFMVTTDPKDYLPGPDRWIL